MNQGNPDSTATSVGESEAYQERMKHLGVLRRLAMVLPDVGLNGWINSVGAVKAAIKSLENQALGARDGARLDALVTDNLSVKQQEDSGLYVLFSGGYPVVGGEFESAREAIDEWLDRPGPI